MSVQNFVILGKQWPNYSTLWPTGPVLRTFVQYLITFCSRLGKASVVIFGVIVDPTGMNVPVKLGDSRSNRSQDIRRPHMRDERQLRHRPTPVITYGKTWTVFFKTIILCANRELIGTHGQAIEWAHPRPPTSPITPQQGVSKSLPFKLQPNGWRSSINVI